MARTEIGRLRRRLTLARSLLQRMVASAVDAACSNGAPAMPRARQSPGPSLQEAVMAVTRREFLGRSSCTAAGTAIGALAALGADLTPKVARAQELRIAG